MSRAMVDSGSPPRAWGRRPGSSSMKAMAAVHPHVRGDGGRIFQLSVHWRGSPPRAWGRRGCDAYFAVDLGSPPRAWGRHPEVESGSFGGRFTPTCVGTAPSSCRYLSDSSVHPHVRGDGAAKLASCLPASGSPPRAWGRRQEGAMAGARVRFTPTCVGTAFNPTSSRAQAAVHPHVRGDGRGGGRRTDPENGSPPRAWGRLALVLSPLVQVRFTPTCVGTASASRVYRARRTVHPHVRGDGILQVLENLFTVGSPPRAWGRP